MSLLNIAYTGLNAFQYALDVTANNISNSTTKGYSRQSILLSPTMGQLYGRSYVGTGVSVNSIYRNADQFANAQVRSAFGTKTQYETFFDSAGAVDQILSQPGTSISSGLQLFFDAFNQLNNAPDSSASRGVALSQSQALVEQFTFMQTNLDRFQEESTAKIAAVANQVNELGANLVALNAQIMGAPNSPELLDQRDQILNDLSQYSELTIMFQGNGTVDVGLSSGEMLVVGSNQRTLSVQFDPQKTMGTRVLLGSGVGQIDISGQLKTGMLGGLMDYENNTIATTSQTIGLMAIGLSITFNAQNKLGMDLNSQLGQNIFTDYNSLTQQLQRSTSSAGNVGSGVLSVNLTHLSQLKLSDYQLTVTDAASNEVRMVRDSDGTATTLNWSSNPPAPPAGQITIDGMTITVDDTAHLSDNDSFVLMPTRDAARNFKMLTNDPNLMALASPVRTSAAMSNTGSGQCALGAVFTTSGVSDQYSIEFISPTQCNVIDVTTNTLVSGPLTFTPNTNNEIQIPDSINPSYSVILSGMPNAGDQFTAEYNQGGFGDNRNGLLLAGIQNLNMFANGNSTLFNSYADLLSDVGSQTHQAKNRAEAFNILYTSAVNFQDSKSGVNLDEEAENLLRFTQAYQATGKLVEVSNQMMQVLFEMMR